MRFTLIHSGGANVFLFDGEIRYSSADRGASIDPGRRRLRDLARDRHVDVVLVAFSLRREATIAFSDGASWSCRPTAWLEHRYELEADDGSPFVHASIGAASHLELTVDGHTVATGIAASPRALDEVFWTVDTDDGVDPWWLAGLLTGVTTCALSAATADV